MTNSLIEGVVLAVILTGPVIVAFMFAGTISSKFHEIAVIANSTNSTHGLKLVELPSGNGTVSCVYASGWFTSQLDCDWRAVK